MKSYDDIFAELSKSTSNMLDSGLADPNEETNKILREHLERLADISRQQNEQIDNQNKQIENQKIEIIESRVSSKTAYVLSIIAILIAFTSLVFQLIL